MSDTRKGFLVPDGIISVFVVSMTALLTAGLLSAAVRTDEVILRKAEETERMIEEGYRECETCVIASPEEDPGSS